MVHVVFKRIKRIRYKRWNVCFVGMGILVLEKFLSISHGILQRSSRLYWSSHIFIDWNDSQISNCHMSDSTYIPSKVDQCQLWLQGHVHSTLLSLPFSLGCFCKTTLSGGAQGDVYRICSLSKLLDPTMRLQHISDEKNAFMILLTAS